MKQTKKRAFFTLFLVVATELIGFGLIIPILPQLGLRLNVGTFWLGVLMAAYSAAQFISAPILGALSDRYGRKPILMLSKVGTMIGYGILAVSNQYSLFLISRLVDGFTGGNISIARAYMADITTPEERPKGMAIIGIAFGVGFIIGPAIGGFLYSATYHQAIPALVAASLSGLALLMTWLFLEEPTHRLAVEAPQKKLLNGLAHIKEYWIMFILGLQLVYMVAFSGFETTFSVFTHIVFFFTEKQNSFLFVYAGIMTLIVQGFITRRKVQNPKRMLIIGIACTATAFALLANSQHLQVMYMGLAVLSIGMGLVGTYLPALLSVRIPPDQQGQVMGVYEGIGSLSRVLGPIIAFSLFSISPSVCYMVFALALGALGISVGLLGKKKWI